MIYIIEDDSLMAAHFSRILKDFNTKTFSNGIDAIKQVDNQPPKLIILDILLDGPSGFSLLNELQSYSDTSRIPVIICSSVSSEFNVKDLKSYGVVALLDKTSMRPRDLYYEVKKWTTADRLSY